MGSALYIVAQKEPSGFEMLMDGKSLAAAAEELGGVCSELGIKPIMAFFSQNLDELADLLGEEVPNAPAEQWFEARDGLATVRALMAWLGRKGTSVRNSARVLDDLKQCERILAHLEQKNIRWHFALDV